MSYRAEIRTVGSEIYTTNSLRFATHAEAYSYALDRAARWTAARSLYIAARIEPVNARWNDRLAQPERVTS